MNYSLNPSGEKYNNWLSRAKLILVWVISLFIFIATYSRALFIIMMSEYDFFSYDLVKEGVFGMTVFYVTTELMMMLAGIALFGLFIPTAEWIKNKKFPRANFIFFGLINILCWLIFFGEIYKSGWSFERNLPPLALSAVAALYLASLLHASRTRRIKSAVALIVTLCSLAAIWQKPMVELLSKGLRAYGVGGELLVQIEYPDGKVTKGKLILLSPENAYVIPEGDPGSIATIRRSAIKIIKVTNKAPVTPPAKTAATAP
ncbi:hypothetical protein [Xanthomonas campestris]|uniref:hypothetical protein n=2 Tax=Xanthomonas campestris TaxID=339 RepID=UPI0023788A7D|nr:hypothetical protein [Xanthomonas campestris]